MAAKGRTADALGPAILDAADELCAQAARCSHGTEEDCQDYHHFQDA